MVTFDIGDCLFFILTTAKTAKSFNFTISNPDKIPATPEATATPSIQGTVPTSTSQTVSDNPAESWQIDTEVSRDFQELSFEADQESQVYLDGALKISRSTCKDRFDFRGRIARTTDFQDITSHLSEKNMVENIFQSRYNFILFLVRHWSHSRAGVKRLLSRSP